MKSSGHAGPSRTSSRAVPRTARGGLLFSLSLALATAWAAAAGAATFTVNRADDIAPRGTGASCITAASTDCTLREAVIKANATAGADVIVFAASLNGVPITLSRAGNDATSSAGDLDVNDSVTITGNGSAVTIIQGATDAAFTNSIGDKVLGINQDGTYKGLTVSISNVTIRWGRNTVPDGDPTFAYTGGGVDVFLTGTGNNITFTGCVITGNENVNSYGGGVNVDSGSADGGATDPVGVFRGTVTFNSCTISGNKSKSTGGGMNLFSDNHDVVVDACTIQNNTTTALGGTGANGGGINARHTNGNQVTIRNGTVISGNTAAGPGGGVCLGGAGKQNVLIQDTTISGNTSLNNVNFPSEGGGLFCSGDATRTTTLTNVTISGNHANSPGTGGSVPAGGGIFVAAATVTVNGTTSVTGNDTAGDGGGIAVPLTGAALAMTGGSITNNSAKGSGGGLVVSNSGSGAGGSATLSRVTLTGNTANSDNAGGGDGGGAFCGTGTLAVSFSRFTGNSALTGGGGTGTAGIRNTGTGAIDATNNWWGAEANAGASGTDGVSTSSGAVTALPRLHLALTAVSSTINLAGTSALTATFTQNSAGTAVTPANLAALIGLPVTFGATLGDISGAQATIQAAGTATATYTGTTPGAGSASAQVDNLPAATAAITVLAPVTVQTSPTGASFTVDAVAHTSAQLYNWVVGSGHPVSTTTPQTITGTPHYFTGWSDAGALAHSYTVPAATATLTASFSPCPAISLTPTFLPGGTVGAVYLQALGAAGGAGGYTFAVTSGSLPTGIVPSGATLTSSGVPLASGAAGTYPVTITATDSNGCTGSRGYVLVVSCPASTLALGPGTLPLGTANAAYAGVTFSAAGATSYTEYGALPNGLTFTGTGLAGTPTQTGVFPITVVAQDAGACVAKRDYYLAVAAVCGAVTITLTPPTLPDGLVGQPYDQAVVAAGGTPSYRYAATAGTLPPGLQLDLVTGHLAGTPTAGGPSSFSITALDANSCAGSQAYSPSTPVELMEFTVE